MRFPLPRIIAATLVLLLPLPALAIVKPAAAPRSALITQGPQERIYAYHTDRQAALKAQPGYRDFLQRYGGTWEVQFDELLATPVWMRGSGIPLIPDYRHATKADVLSISQQFLRDNRALFQADVKELQPLSVDFYDDIWVVYFEKRHGGIPVVGSNVELVYKFGRLVLIYGESYPVRDVKAGALQENLPAAEATGIARDELSLAADAGDAARRVIYPIVSEAAVDYRLAWEITQRRPAQEGASALWFVSYVDAATGKILEIQDRVRHQFSGNISSRVDTRTVGDPIITVPNRDGRAVLTTNGTTYADASGNWTRAGSGSDTLTLNIRGLHTNVLSSTTAEMTISHSITAGTPSNDLFNASSATDLAQTDTYRAVQATNEMLRQEYTTNTWLNTTVMTANVNLNQTCNAYWDGSSINMFVAGGGCNNTGRIFDVVAHEYGHGADQNLPGGAGDGGLGEFIGDLNAFVQTDNDTIGPFFFTGGGGVRDLDPSGFPCYNSSVSEVHDQGEMLGAVIWDIWVDLKPLFPVRSDLQKLMVRPIGTSQTRSAWYNGLLVADDDDGNLANGTPHACIIWAQYDAHSCGAQRWPTVPAAPGPPCSNAPPVANFSGTPTSGNAPLTVNFTDLTIGTPTSWSWTFGDGATSTTQNPSHVYTNPGQYTVSLTATNAQGSDTETKTNYITVNAPAPPVADFSGTPLSGGAPLNVQFTDLTTGSVTSWSWTFGDGGTSTAQNPSHTYNAVGSYTVALTATGPLGTDTETKVNYVTVIPALFCDNFDSGAAGWTHGGNPDQWTNGTPSGVANDPPAAFSAPNEYGTDHGTGGTDSMYEPNDTTFLQSPSVNCSAATSVTLSYKRWLAVEQAIYDQASIYVNGTQVWQNAQNGDHIDSAWTDHVIDISAQAAGQASVVIRFEIVSDGGLEYGGWNIDDFCLMGSGGGGNAPVADFSGSPLSGTAPLAVNFVDASTNTPTSWSWNFGDGGTSTAQSPSHTYVAAGSYTVSLTATNASGSDTETKVNYVTVTTPGGVTEEIVSGAGASSANAPVVKTWNHASPPAQVSAWTAYGASDWGVNVASVDMVGGGTVEVATGPGPGANYGPQIRGWQASGTAIAKVNFYAYGTLRYGAHPAGGNLDGDVHGEILTTPGPGSVFGPHVRGWNFDNVALAAMNKITFFAYSTLRYGARSAGGDTDADGFAEITTGAGAGAVFSSHVRGFNYDNSAIGATFSFFAFGSGQYGAAVAVGNTDADARHEIVAAHGPDPASNSEVKGFEHNGGVANQWSVIAFAGALGGSEAGVGDLDADGQDELVVGTGWGAANASRIVGYEIVGSGGTAIGGLDYSPYAGQTYGAKVSVGDVGI